MPRLRREFTALDMTGFEIDKSIRHTSVNRQMVDTACSVLQKNGIEISVRLVMDALKQIYGLGGSAENLCNLLRDWRKDNLEAVKAGRNETDIFSAILNCNTILDKSEVPTEFLQFMEQQAIIGYTFAWQKADTSVSGDRIKLLSDENDLLKSQLIGLPKMELELGFYREQYLRKDEELKEAYINLSKQKLADSEVVGEQITALQQERNELVAKNNELAKQVSEMAEFQGKAVERDGEIARLNGALEARERETFAMREQIQNLQAEVGQKQILQTQLAVAQVQLKSANESITKLQAQVQESNSELQVDIDVDSLNSEIRKLTDERDTLKLRVEELEAQVVKKGNKPQKPQRETVAA
ncbi:hypothetical protein [Cylindrospermum sp. FACHB-282]|uniref:hypothetical protein n=1 Tax=Cylindrospermum sp. FACHB-282 TaxID=2692794 RepID=UPI0016878EBA|nr:hypothetical protein [Cylindrospermum sp. FACHB-282]MBD2386041.1 hypothetical protein [Cylindrospermum sp. FACHB-282]